MSVNQAESNSHQKRSLVYQPPTTMSRRLYLGSKNPLILLINTFHSETTGLPTDARTEDVQKFFDGFGRIIDCRVMTGTF